MNWFVSCMRTALVITWACALISACATPAQPGGMVPTSLAVKQSCMNSPLCGALAVGTVGGGQETDPLYISRVGDKGLREAVRESLARYGFLGASGNAAPYRLDVFLVELKQPERGLTMTAVSFVRYKISRNQDGKVMYEEIITGTYKATMDDAFVGAERRRLAIEGSIRAGIAEFLSQLNKWDPGSVLSR